MNSTDIEMMLRRADATDKRMQHLQEQIDDLKSQSIRRLESICALATEVEDMRRMLAPVVKP